MADPKETRQQMSWFGEPLPNWAEVKDGSGRTTKYERYTSTTKETYNPDNGKLVRVEPNKK